MDKKCKVCGTNASIEAKFCQNCGSSDFITIDHDQTERLTASNNSYQKKSTDQNPYKQQNNYEQDFWQPPVSPNNHKKKNTNIVVGIIVTVFVVLPGIGATAQIIFKNQDYNNHGGSYDFDISDSNDSSTKGDNSESSEVEYTKGEFDGSTYINEWADIKLNLPSGFSNADSSLYNASENSTSDCGAYFLADDTMSLIIIGYEKLPSFPKCDEKDYLDGAMKTLDSSPTGLTYQTTSDYVTKTIGGYSYLSAECKVTNRYGDFIQTIYVRKLGDYMVNILILSTSSESCNNLVKMISRAN